MSGWIFISDADVEEADKCDCDLCVRVTEEEIYDDTFYKLDRRRI